MNSYLMDRIEREIAALSPAEARVAGWVLENPHRAVEASISDVAAATRVSEPTVIRFCRSVGVSGFRELKTRLIAALERPESFLHQNVNVDDSTRNAVSKVLESSIRTLIDMRELIPDMPFDAAVSAMSGAHELIFNGLGASGHVARDARHKFFRLGIPCSTALDSQTMLQRAAIIRPGDVCIAISHTGGWPEMVHAMQLARKRGATVIALTDPHAALAEAATLVFECHPPEDTNLFTPMSSRLAQLAVLDALQVALALEQGAIAQENLELSKAVLNRERSITRLPDPQQATETG